ncbi:MAG: CpaE family protein, partial [Opitutales bacterium]
MLAPIGTPSAVQIWKPLVVCPQRDLAARVRAAFTELGITAGTHLPEYPRLGSLAGVAGMGGCNICLLDVASNVEHALLLIAEAAAAMPVVALSPRKDADLILRCLHRGAGEFLADPTSQQLRVSLDRLVRLRGPAGAPKPSTVYCAVPGKPGCGASTLALHLAIEIKRSGASRVLLVDTDVVGGTIAFLLKVKPEFHLGDAVRDRQRLDADLWSRLTVLCHGVDVLLAPENPAAAVELDRTVAADLLTFWQAHYEAIVLDTAGAQPGAVDFIRLCDQILLVATNELVALHATRRSVEYLEKNGIDRRRLRLVVNRYSPATGLKRDEVQSALKLDPYVLLANEYETVQQAVLDGQPVGPGTRFDRGLRALAARLTGKEAPAEKKPAWLGLLPRRG